MKKVKEIKKLLNLPVFLFLIILFVAFISIFGSRNIISLGNINSPSTNNVLSAEDPLSSSIIEECAFYENALIPCEYEPDQSELDLYGVLTVVYSANNDAWLGGYAATAKIDEIPGLSYFSDLDYEPESKYSDFVSTSFSRLHVGRIYDASTGEYICYDITMDMDGFASLYDKYGNFLGNVGYDDGGGVLIGSMGDPSDPTHIFKIPEQFIIPCTDDIPYPDSQIDSSKGSNIADEALDILEGIGALFRSFFEKTGPKCEDTPFIIDSLYTKDTSKGFESMYNTALLTYSFDQIVEGSNLMTQIGGECTKDERNPNNLCKVKTDLSDCENCRDELIPVDDPEYDHNLPWPQYREVCDIEFNDAKGLIKYNDKANVKQCILSKGSLSINHTLSAGAELRLGGLGEILATNWKLVQRFSDKNICIGENIGIEVGIQSKLYDIGYTSLEIPPKEDCSAQEKFAVSTYPQVSSAQINAYYPYFGNVIQSLRKYYDTNLFSLEENPLPYCNEGFDEETGLCYCNEDQVDYLAIYVYLSGNMSDEELSMYGLDPDEVYSLIGVNDGAPFVDATSYSGTCSEIFEKVKKESPFSSSSVIQGLSYRSGSVPGAVCWAGNPGEIVCNSTMEGWCNSCPIKATALFRHELHHKYTGGSGGWGSVALSEFAADATSANGGWYGFISPKYSPSSYIRATTIVSLFLEEHTNVSASLFEDYLYGSISARDEIEDILGISDFTSYMLYDVLSPEGYTIISSPPPPDLVDCSK